MEIELTRSRRKLEALVAAAPILMMLTDADGVIESANRPLLGIAPEDAVGRNILSLLADPAEAARVLEFHRTVVTSRGSQVLTTQLDDGRTLTTWARAITDGDQVVGVASATADMSERRNRERELLEAVSREQRRIGLDLHDGIGQELTGLALMLKSLAIRCAREAPQVVPALEAILEHVSVAKATARAVARGASPVGPEQGGLAHAFEELGRYWQDAGGVPIHCRVAMADDADFAPLVAENVYRIAQEALTNAARHSGATRIELDVIQTPRRITLAVTDDGRGIAAGADQGGGMGLKIMRMRAEIVGARLNIDAQSGGGTRVECVWEMR
jgi:PAS domain S-box-containing protein